MKQLSVFKRRTNVVQVSLGFNASQDTFVSEIRAEKNSTSELLATWIIGFATDGTDGELLLTLDDSVTSSIDKSVGYMDIKRISNGEPLTLFDEELQVLFREPITE